MTPPNKKTVAQSRLRARPATLARGTRARNPSCSSGASATNQALQDTHDVIGQWDHPKPSMLEQVHGDHPSAALPLRRGTLRKCPNTAAVLLRRSTRLRPRCLRSTVSRPEASTRKRGNQRTGTPSGPTAVTAGRPMSTSVAVWASSSTGGRDRASIHGDYGRRVLRGSVATSDGPAALLGYPVWAIPLIALFGAGGAIVAIRVFG